MSYTPTWDDFFPGGAELVQDVSAARWVEERLIARPFAGVGALLPDVFDRYARVLHPAVLKPFGPTQQVVTWAEVARRNGSQMHPLVQFERIANLSRDPDEQPDWGHRPFEGDPSPILEPLVPVLRDFTATPERIWYAVWFGFGGLDMMPWYETTPRIKSPGREYLVLRGPLDSVGGFDDGPQIWWPEDKAWCVSTDIDLDSTYIGATKECIERVLAEPGLESWPASIDDRVDIGADQINDSDIL